MLKQEHRRLKEQDIKKIKERTSRQQFKKKMAIVESIQEANRRVDSFYERRKFRVQETIQGQMNNTFARQSLKNEMDTWAQTGFKSARQTMSTQFRNTSPTLTTLVT